jgi:hypothetical protein
MKHLRFFALTLAGLTLAACGDNGPTDYIRIAGGGLTFNYRYSQASMVLVGKQMAALPEGGTVEALFDIPGEATPERVSRPVIVGKLTYKMESKFLTGVKKGVPLKVVLRVLDRDGKEIDREETAFTSDVDQDTLPSKPLVDPKNPGYVPQLQNLDQD